MYTHAPHLRRVMQRTTVGTPRWTVYCLLPAPAQMPACNWKHCVWHTRKSNGWGTLLNINMIQLDGFSIRDRLSIVSCLSCIVGFK